jgi:hypothetical protein
MRDPIPNTELVKTYKDLKEKPQKERLERARQLVRIPGELENEFQRSVRDFSRYRNAGEHFRPNRKPYKGKSNLKTTRTLAALLKGSNQPIRVHDNSNLDFSYVDREMVIARTTGNARYDNEEKATTGVRADLLLKHEGDGLPIIGEVKIATDQDPFSGLIQGLACASQLVTPNQLDRLSRHFEQWKGSKPAQVHVYVIVARIPAHERVTYWYDLAREAITLGSKLRSPHLSSIAFLEVSKSGPNAVVEPLDLHRVPHL